MHVLPKGFFNSCDMSAAQTLLQLKALDAHGLISVDKISDSIPSVDLRENRIERPKLRPDDSSLVGLMSIKSWSLPHGTTFEGCL